MRSPLAVLGLLVGLALGFACSFVGPASASRNSGGTYSLPAGNPVVTGTTITSTWANNTLSDLSSEMTNSLDRNGRGAMLAPLQLVSSGGTLSAPAICFSGDSNSGIYRVGADDLALVAGGVKALEWTSSLVDVPLAADFHKGVGITQSTANGLGIQVTGNGTGRGVDSTGGSTGGTGVQGTGGAGGGTGVKGVGDGTGFGVHAVGGDTSAAGTYSTGGAPNGKGVQGNGDGTGSGVEGNGGDSSGYGGAFFGGAPNGVGLFAIGAGGGSGEGAVFQAGTASSSSARTGAVKLSGGDLVFDSVTAPESTTSISNRLTPMGLVKVWGHLNGTTPSVESGANITSVSCSSQEFVVTIAANMADTTYAVICSPGTSTVANCRPTSIGTGSFNIAAYDFAGAQINLCSSSSDLSFLVLGAQ